MQSEEERKPAPKANSKPAAKTEPMEVDSSSEEEESSDEEAEAPKATKPAAAKAASEVARLYFMLH